MSAVTTEIQGDLARVAFINDEAANKIFKAALGNIATRHREGAWQIELPTDNPKFRDQVVARVEKAALAVEPRLQELAAGASRAKELAAIITNELGEQFAPNMSVQNRGSTLAITIPPLQDAIDELKTLGATRVASRSETHAAAYWQIPVHAPDSTLSASIHEERLLNGLALINEAVIAQNQNKSLATTLGSPHPEIQLATKDDWLFVSAPHMAETYAILKADGAGQMNWDSKTATYTVPVSADNIDDITKRLSDLGQSYDTALIPPYAGKPGVVLNEQTAEFIATKTSEDYAKDPSVRHAITAFNDAVHKALSPDDLAAIRNNNTASNERVTALHTRSPITLPYIENAIRSASAIERDGEVLIREASARQHTENQTISR